MSGAWVGGGAGEVGSRSWRVSLSTPRAMLGSDGVPFQGNVSNSLRLPCSVVGSSGPGAWSDLLFGLSSVLSRGFAWCQH